MRTLTLRLMVCSTRPLVVGDELQFSIPGDGRRKGKSRWRRLEAPIFDSLLEGDQHNQALLLERFTEQGVASTVG
jgi:hypothetical protein